MKGLKYAMLSILLVVGSCTNNFEELQKNPNLPESVNPGLLLPSIIFPAVNSHVGNSREITGEIMQYTARNNSFTEVQRFIFTLGMSTSVWNGFYGRLRDIIVMEDLSKDLGNPNYEAIALILKSWSFSILTDVFNEVPYQEAGLAIKDANFAPMYDSQKTIYEGMLADLEKANQIMDVALGLSYGGDILFNGDVLKWKKFANSLRLRLLMRVSNKPEMNAAASIKEMFDNPSQYPFFQSNADHAVYEYKGTLPDVFPHFTEREFDFNNFAGSAFMINTLKQLEDPRLQVYFEPTKNSVADGTPEYVGLPSGISAGDAFEYNGGRDGQSLINNANFLLNAKQKGILLTYSEVQFLLSEAALRGMIDGDPKEFYEKGVTASIQYWGAEVPADYLTTGEGSWNGDEERLFLQKYLALFWCGFEAWFDYRRTGYPQIVPGPANVNSGKVPVRLMYPTIEQSLNEENYGAAVSRIGGDNINSLSWWESF